MSPDIGQVSSYTKVTGSMSKSCEQSKPVHALINFDQQFSSLLTRWHHWQCVAGGRAL